MDAYARSGGLALSGPEKEVADGRLRCRWTVTRLDPAPPHWPALIGDVVHNLRSALDNAIWAHVVAAHGEKYADRYRFEIAFPVTETKTQLSKQRVLNT